GACFLGIPLFAGEMIPVRVRVGFGLMLALMLSEFAVADLQLADHFMGLILLAMNEVCIGLMMALTIRMVFFALQLAGHVISYEIGLMASSSVNPLLGSSDATITSLLYFFGLLLFFVTGIHYDVLRALAGSLQVMPIGKFLLGTNPVDEFIRDTGQIFIIGTLMAAPFIALNFLVNISFAVLGKAVPKMNVFMTSFAVRIMCGLLLLVSCALLITAYIVDTGRQSAGKALFLLSQ
ncbi:MAG: flagellar biosynthetic protein FliR, partial [Opitutales bacterium]